jgi:hypothetical protein
VGSGEQTGGFGSNPATPLAAGWNLVTSSPDRDPAPLCDLAFKQFSK